jgi:ferredoxin
MNVQAFKGIKKSSIIPAGILAVFVFWWYSQPYIWLGIAAGLAAGLLMLVLLHTGRIERWRRVFFTGGGTLALVALLAYFFSIGPTNFRQMVSSWNPGYYFPGTAGAGAMPFPTPVTLPVIFWRGAQFIDGFGVWQTAIPTSLAGFFIFMIPVILIAGIFGRSLCGWLCPLGGLPELTAATGKEWWKLGFLKQKKVSSEGVSYRELKPWVQNIRYGLLAIIVALSLTAGFSLVNIFYPVLWLKWTPAFWVIIGTLGVTAVALPLVTRRRWWCYVCPVGAILSPLERTSLFRLSIDKKKCIGCLDCVRACRYYALTPQGIADGKYDGQYCVRCGRCIEACSEEALDITWLGSKHKARTTFLSLIVALGFAFYAWFAIQAFFLLSNVDQFRWFR